MLYVDILRLFLTKKYQKIKKKKEIVNVRKENRHIFRKTWSEILVNF